MKLEDQLTSLEPSMKLDELGVKRESAFYLVGTEHGWEIKPEHTIEYYQGKFDVYSAYSVAELGEMLPMLESGGFDFYPHTIKFDAKYKCIYVPIYKHGYWKNLKYKEDIKEADARAKMLIYLIENGLIEVEDLNKENV